jgi:hypothetical protein
MNATLITDDVIGLLAKRFGLPQRFDKSRILAFGSALSCSVNYSKLLAGHRYFFGLSKGVVDESNDFPDTELGDFVLLICGSSDNVLVLPRALVLTLMEGVSSRRIDVFVEDGVHILQTTRHPKLNVTEFLNEYPKLQRATPEPLESSAQKPPDRVHVRIQWSLIQLGLAEGCSVWVPPNDRNLAYEQRSFSSSTIKKLPNFGFDENTRRIVGNIDVLWLHKNVIAKAFEVESTTSIYSGLLRLNDLALSQPNNRIDLYVVASESRRQAVYSQLTRPSFHPLISQCRYLGFATIDEQYSRILNMGVDTGTRVAGLIKGERFELPDNYVYPSS